MIPRIIHGREAEQRRFGVWHEGQDRSKRQVFGRGASLFMLGCLIGLILGASL